MSTASNAKQDMRRGMRRSEGDAEANGILMKGNGGELSEFGAKCEERKRESKGADGGRDDSKKDDHN